MTKAEKSRPKVSDLERKFEKLLDQFKKESNLKSDNTTKEIKETKSPGENIVPSTGTESTKCNKDHINKVIVDTQHVEDMNNKNSWKECLVCDKKFKAEVTSLNHDKMFHLTSDMTSY